MFAMRGSKVCFFFFSANKISYKLDNQDNSDRRKKKNLLFVLSTSNQFDFSGGYCCLVIAVVVFFFTREWIAGKGVKPAG